MKILVAIPAFEGRINIETVKSLLEEQAAALLAGVEMLTLFIAGGSVITAARDQIVEKFLETDCERLVFIDADVSWQPGDLIRLAQHPVPFVGGCYRHKQEPESYPIAWLDKPELWGDPKTGLLEVASLPAGFLALDRRVFARLKEAFPQRSYTHFGHDLHAYFWNWPGASEDGTLCKEWRDLGGQVWLDPELTLTHTGGRPSYTGNIAEWLRSRMKEAA